jgi:hypothetical protein
MLYVLRRLRRLRGVTRRAGNLCVLEGGGLGKASFPCVSFEGFGGRM